MDSQYWFYVKDGKVSRPVNEQELNRLYEENYLNGDVLLCKVGVENWKKFRDHFVAIDAPPVPLSSLQQEYAVVIAISPLISMYLVRWLLPILIEFKIDLFSISYWLMFLFWSFLHGWCVAGDENLIKNGIQNYPAKYKFSNIIPFAYLIRRNLYLRRTYLKTDWMSVLLLAINVFTFAYVFGY